MNKKIKRCSAKTKKDEPCMNFASIGNLCMKHFLIKRYPDYQPNNHVKDYSGDKDDGLQTRQ